MDPLLVLVQALHILAGVVWLGGSVFMNVVVLPALLALPSVEQRAMARRVIFGPERMMIGAALLAAALGIVRGTVYGPIDSLDSLATPYGIAWSAAAAITVMVFAVGGTMTSRTAHALLDDDRYWSSDAREDGAEARAALVARLRMAFRLELIGILAVFALMPLLRFL
jgi:uncharacterized membrane protein